MITIHKSKKRQFIRNRDEEIFFWGLYDITFYLDTTVYYCEKIEYSEYRIDGILKVLQFHLIYFFRLIS